MKFEIAFLVVIGIIVAIASAVLFRSGNTAMASAVILGFVASSAYMLIGFFSTIKAFDKPAASFYRLFFGSLSIRFLFFLATLFVIYKFTPVSVLSFAVFFILFYVIFQGLEIRYIWQKLERQKLK